jgi:hypothetical protein
MPNDVAVIFVGCGGTYWTSGNYFCSLLKRLQPLAIRYLDPDWLTPRNTERQWCREDNFNILGISKVASAKDTHTPKGLLARTSARTCTFQAWALEGDVSIGPRADVIVIVNVDVDDARLAVREWCVNRGGRTLMVMSGCDMNYGQVYFGVYENYGAVHDWKPFHLEVGDPNHKPIDGNEPQGCGAQSTLSNLMTGALFGPAILEAVTFWKPEGDLPVVVGEYYWRRNPKTYTTKAWTTVVARTAVEPEEIL